MICFLLEILLVPIKREQKCFTVISPAIIIPVDLCEATKSAVKCIGNDTECGSLVFTFRVEVRCLEPMLARPIEQFPALELASVLLEEASESCHLLLCHLL